MIAVPPETTWYWQLSGRVHTTAAATLYDIDQEDASTTLVATLAASHTMIGYFSAGTWESWRPDASMFPAAAIGRSLPDWPGEKYLDIRKPDVRTIMGLRMDAAKAKGFVGIEPDNLDSFENKSGFLLTKQDAISYIKWLAAAAHQRGMVCALKNT